MMGRRRGKGGAEVMCRGHMCWSVLHVMICVGMQDMLRVAEQSRFACATAEKSEKTKVCVCVNIRACVHITCRGGVLYVHMAVIECTPCYTFLSVMQGCW